MPGGEEAGALGAGAGATTPSCESPKAPIGSQRAEEKGREIGKGPGAVRITTWNGTYQSTLTDWNKANRTANEISMVLLIPYSYEMANIY